jgi:hypothetical protein
MRAVKPSRRLVSKNHLHGVDARELSGQRACQLQKRERQHGPFTSAECSSTGARFFTMGCSPQNSPAHVCVTITPRMNAPPHKPAFVRAGPSRVRRAFCWDTSRMLINPTSLIHTAASVWFLFRWGWFLSNSTLAFSFANDHVLGYQSGDNRSP